MDDRGIAKHIGMFLDKPLGGPNFHAVRAPSKLANRRGVPSPDEVAPEGLLVFGDQFDDLYRKGTVLDVELKPLDELVNVVNDRWASTRVLTQVM